MVMAQWRHGGVWWHRCRTDANVSNWRRRHRQIIKEIWEDTAAATAVAVPSVDVDNSIMRLMFYWDYSYCFLWRLR